METKNSWKKYYEKNQGRGLRPLYLKALPFLHSSAAVALDLGCGDGKEVLDLLARGFQVHAMDQEQEAIDLILQQSDSVQLLTYVSSLENWQEWPQVDFLFAHHSLPFCRQEKLDNVLEQAISTLKPDGIFAASFFGLEDEWVVEGKTTGVSTQYLEGKLSAFDLLHVEETKKQGKTALQGDKMWNVIDVIARRRSIQDMP